MWIRVTASGDSQLSANNVINQAVRTKYAIEGAYHLTILDVELSDAGTYACVIGSAPNDVRHLTELIVLGKPTLDFCTSALLHTRYYVTPYMYARMRK